MDSMTGYGRGEAASGDLEVAVEICTVNKRALDINFSLPREWQGLERGLAEKVRAAVRRGRASVSVQLQSHSEAEELNWDDEAAGRTLKKLSELAKKQNVPFEADAPLLLRIVSCLRKTPEMPGLETARPLIESALDKALGELKRMREEEGAALAKDLSQRNRKLRQLVERIRAAADRTVSDYREALLRRLRQAGLELDLEDERVLKEIALFADRCDISEEVTRLESHLEQFAHILEENSAVGRKLEFLLQEVLRETNTISSKANNLEIIRHALAAKNEIERLREQLQNVE